MIEAMLENLRESFHETRERGGLYGIVTEHDTHRHLQFLRVSWVDYTDSTAGATLCLLTQPQFQHPETISNGIDTIAALLSELRLLRQEAVNVPPAPRL